MDILVALYDGFLRHTAAAELALTKGERAKAGEAIGKAIAIVTELQASIDFRHDAQFGERLSALYSWVIQTLIKANVEQSPARVVETTGVMRELRSAWAEAAVNVRAERAAG
jgi:flagellar protein FliS